MRIWKLRVLRQTLRLVLGILHLLVATTSAVFKSRSALHLENLALRHQLGVQRRSVKRPKLTSADGFLWVSLCGVWSGWRSALVIVRPWRRAPESVHPDLPETYFLRPLKSESTVTKPRPTGAVAGKSSESSTLAEV